MQRIGLAVYGLGVGTSQSLMSLGGAWASITGLLTSMRHARRSTGARRERLCVAAALLWLCFSIANLVARGWQGRDAHTLSHLPLVLVPLAAWSARKNFSRTWTFGLAAGGLAATALAAIYQYFWIGSVAVGLMRNPIYFAYNVFPAFLFFAESLRDRASLTARQARLARIAVAAASLSLLLSENRMVWLCGGLYLGVRVAPLVYRRWGWRRVLLLAFLGLGTASVLYATQERVREKLHRSFSSQDPSRAWRFKAWSHNLSLFRESPWVGVGAERNAIDPAQNPSLQGHWQEGRLYFAHSVYIQSLADAGLIGTLLFFGFLALFGASFPQCQIYLLLMGFAGLTENIFNNSRAGHAFYFYLLLSAVFLTKNESRHGSAR